MDARGWPTISIWQAALSSKQRWWSGVALLGVAAVMWQTVGLALQSGSLTVTGTLSIAGFTAPDKSEVVAWLSPAGDAARPQPGTGKRFKIVQHQKRFQPHVLAVPVGSFVDFPNLDPIFHNVFSLFDGKRFDLGLYEAGTTRGVSFTKPGVCFVFCNIHPEMSAGVVVVDSPYFTTSSATGTLTIADVPPGRYRLSLWHERFKPENSADYPKDVTVSATSTSLGVIRLVEAKAAAGSHTNKFGQDYVPPGATSPIYP